MMSSSFTVGDEGDPCSSQICNLSAVEIAMMIDSIENDHPEVKALRMMASVLK